jgi:putative transcriptional regulator
MSQIYDIFRIKKTPYCHDLPGDDSFILPMEKEILLKNLGARIRKIRNKKGISQKQLAHSIGKDQQSVQRLEAGNINPTYYYLYE